MYEKTYEVYDGSTKLGYVDTYFNQTHEITIKEIEHCEERN